MEWLLRLIDRFMARIYPDTPPNDPPQAPISTVAVSSKSDELYTLSKSLIGRHLSLNENVPWMVGCAESVSQILQMFGIKGIPFRGFEGTAAIGAFLRESPAFKKADAYAPGRIILAETGTGNGKIRGHVGVCGNNSIMSNNSETGKWDTQWNESRWVAYYNGYGAIPISYFTPV